MAVTEEDGGRKKKLPSWDTVEKSAPDRVVGSASFKPLPPRSPAPIPGARFDPSRLKSIRNYLPAPEPSDRSTSSPAPSMGASLNIPETVARVNGTEPKPEVVEEQDALPVSKTYRLTWDEYNKLSEDQRAAVDFNTLLVQGREKDLRLQGKYEEPTAPQKQAYDTEVRERLGAERGSETFAPETLAVLKQIDFQGDGEDDLDDFLSLENAVTARELKDFSFDIPDPVKTSLPEAISAITNLEGQEQTSYKTSNRLAESMAKAGDVLQSFRASARQNRNPDVLAFGGRYNEVPQPQGYKSVSADGEKDLNWFVQEALRSLQRKDIEPTEVIDWINSTGLDPDEEKVLMQYLDEQTRPRVGIDVKPGKGMRSAEEIRSIVGLNKGGGRDAR